MDLNDVKILPVDPGAHFSAVAALMNTVETEPNTPESLAEWYTKRSDDGLIFAVAVDPAGVVLGFSGLYRLNTNLDRYFGIYLVVARETCGGRGWAACFMITCWSMPPMRMPTPCERASGITAIIQSALRNGTGLSKRNTVSK